jgi:fructose-bisphosphate aldolase class II
VDGDVGSKKAYDPRSYLSAAETAMAGRVRQVAHDLRAAGTTMMQQARRAYA